jgi:hypothetical protein
VPKKKPIKVVHGKLGRQGAVGLAYAEERVIILDPRLKGFEYLETAIHEVIHCQNPKWPEITVEARAKEMADILWTLGFRHCDNYKE